MRRFRNPAYAPESLERKLSPSGIVAAPVAAEVYVPAAPVPVALSPLNPATSSVTATSPTDPPPPSSPTDPAPPTNPDPLVPADNTGGPALPC